MALRVRAPEERTPTASLSQAREWQQLETHKQMLLRSIRQRLASLAGSEDIEAVRGALTMFEPVRADMEAAWRALDAQRARLVQRARVALAQVLREHREAGEGIRGAHTLAAAIGGPHP